MKPIHYILITLVCCFTNQVLTQPLLQWDKRFNGPVGSDRGNSITVDSSGNVYVTGRSIGTNTNYDYLTIKYNSDGDTLWWRRFNGAANKSDEPVTIKVDNQGNVYVTGKTERANGSFDIATIKYDSLGSIKWNSIYNGSIPTGDDLAYNIEVDEFSNVYVVGSSFDHYVSSNYTKGIIIQYNYLGVQQWKAYYGDFINKVLIYDLDKLLIISNSPNRYHIFELDANNGTQLLDYPGGTLFDNFGMGNDMIIDDAGNIYVVSSIEANFYVYVYTTKFTLGNTNNPIGTFWRYELDPVSAYTGISIKLDKNKNVYTLASVTSGINYCTISKRNASMENVWIKQYYLENSIDVYPVSFSLRRKSINPDIYVSGYTSLGDIITAKFDNNDESVPNLLWEVPYDCGNEGTDVASMMVQDQYDNIYITGYSNCDGTSDDVKTIKYCVNVPMQPGNISGDSIVCVGSNITYSVSLDTMVESYTWFLPNGWTGQSMTNSIEVVPDTPGTISVIANGLTCSSEPQTFEVIVNHQPDTPGAISGDDSVCSGTENTYSIPLVPGALSYIWNLPPGWSGTPTANSINTIASETSGSITVTAINNCGFSIQTLPITVTKTPVTPDTIFGNSAVCKNTPQTYSITSDLDATGYLWTLPLGWIGSSFDTSITSIAVSSGNIMVSAINGQCSSAWQTLSVTVNTKPNTPDPILGSTEICGIISNAFSVPPVDGATSYTWTLPSGWSAPGSNNGITVLAGSSGNIMVTANNMCGSSDPQTLSVTVSNQVPEEPELILGNSSVCKYSTNTYAVNSDTNVSSYNWSLPPGWSGFSNNNSIDLQTGSSGGTLTLNVINACGSSAKSWFISIIPVDTSVSISQNRDTLTANATNAMYQWVRCPLLDTIVGETHQSYTPSLNGEYAVIISQGGCTEISRCIEIITGLWEKSLSNKINLFPNPTNGEIVISSEGLSFSNLAIYNLLGQQIYYSSDESQNHITTDIGLQPPGTYIISLNVEGVFVYKRFVKL
jgi:hypothetical protein